MGTDFFFREPRRTLKVSALGTISSLWSLAYGASEELVWSWKLPRGWLRSITGGKIFHNPDWMGAKTKDAQISKSFELKSLKFCMVL